MSSEFPIGSLGKKEYHFRNTIRMEENLLNLSGLHPQNLPSLLSLGVLKPFTSLALVTYMVISICMPVFFYDFDIVVESLMLGCGMVRFLFKISVFLHHRSTFAAVMEDFDDEVFYSFTVEDLVHIKAEVKRTRILGLMHFSSILVYTVFLAISPFIFDKEFQLVLVWKPMAMGVVTYFCHLYALCFAAVNHTCMDNVFMMMSTFVGLQFDVIVRSLRRIDFRKHQEAEVVLKRHIIRHLRILGFVNKMNCLVSYMALIQYLISILAICVTLFQIMKNPQDGSNITFLLCMIVEIILYCWFGEAIKDKNTDLSTTLYLTNWEEADVKIRKLILMVGERCKKPIKLDVGGFTSMTLNSFLNIMKSAYSAFTVLRQVYN